VEHPQGKMFVRTEVADQDGEATVKQASQIRHARKLFEPQPDYLPVAVVGSRCGTSSSFLASGISSSVGKPQCPSSMALTHWQLDEWRDKAQEAMMEFGCDPAEFDDLCRDEPRTRFSRSVQVALSSAICLMV
jgi:hypothetical protein